MLPLPSLIHSAARDAACKQMRAAARTSWCDADYDLACREQQRLIATCYGTPTDGDLCFARFSVAEVWERQQRIGLTSDWNAVLRQIDAVLA